MQLFKNKNRVACELTKHVRRFFWKKKRSREPNPTCNCQREGSSRTKEAKNKHDVKMIKWKVIALEHSAKAILYDQLLEN